VLALVARGPANDCGCASQDDVVDSAAVAAAPGAPTPGLAVDVEEPTSGSMPVEFPDVPAAAAGGGSGGTTPSVRPCPTYTTPEAMLASQVS
jgi:hypothetical protein